MRSPPVSTLKALATYGVAFLCFASVPAFAQGDPAEAEFVLGRVRVGGNKFLKDGAIKNLLGVEKGERYEEYNFDYLLEAGLAAVEAAYYAEGFEAVRVDSELKVGKKDKRDLKIIVEEGPRATVKEVDLVGVAPERLAAVRDALDAEVGAPLSAAKLNEAAVRVGDYYHERGYGRAKVTAEINRKAAVVIYTVDEGQKYYIDEVVASGNERTHAVIVTREINYKLNPSRLWNASKLDEGHANVYKTGLYRDLVVDVVDSEDAPGRADVVVIPQAETKVTGVVDGAAGHVGQAALVGKSRAHGGLRPGSLGQRQAGAKGNQQGQTEGNIQSLAVHLTSSSLIG